LNASDEAFEDGGDGVDEGGEVGDWEERIEGAVGD